MVRAKLRVNVKGGTGPRGHSHKGYTKYVPDKGKEGRTKEEDKWYEPGRETGWSKEEPQQKRIRTILSSQSKLLTPHNRKLRAFRQLNSLANVSTDSETVSRARSDATALRRQL